MDLFKDILPAIFNHKPEVLVDAESTYNPFVINRALSYYQDCIFYADQMNRLHHLDKRAQITYYLNTIRPRRRPFVRWSRPEKEKDLQAVKTYYNYSDRQASEVLQILTADQLAYIKEKTTIGEVCKLKTS